MNQWLKVALIGLVMVYIASPLDVVPGPADDILVTLIGLAGAKRLTGSKKHF